MPEPNHVPRRVRATLRALAVTAAVVAQSAIAAAQTEIRLPASPSCASCRLDIVRVATLGGDDGELLNEPLTMARDALGRFYMTYRPPQSHVAVFDSVGRSLGNIGRSGKGPGEFTSAVSVLAEPSGRIHVWDMDFRLSAFDPSRRFERSVNQRAAPLLILAGGSSVGNFSPVDAGANRSPITIFDRNGRPTATIGQTPGPSLGPEAWRANRVIGRGSGDTTFWSARPDTYRLEEWSASGRLLKEVVRSPSWFRPVRQMSAGVTGVEPTPTPQALAVDRDGLLWFVVAVANPGWRSHLGPPRESPSGRVTYAQRAKGSLWHAMIEVVDTRSGQLLVSQRVPENLRFILGDNLMASYRDGADGSPYVDIWRVRLLR